MLPAGRAAKKPAGKLAKNLPKQLDAMLMALNVGDIDIISTYNTTADYLSAKNDQLVKVIDFKVDPDVADDPSVDYYSYTILHGITNNSFSFLTTEDKADLRDEIDRILAEMKSDGTLDTLVKEYISDYEKQENKDVPEGAITTQPYYSDLMIPVTLKER